MNLYCINFTKLRILVCNIFSNLYSKIRDITINKINILKTDLNLVQIKWKVQQILYRFYIYQHFIFVLMYMQEMNLSYILKFHMLYEHVPNILLEMNSFCNIEQNTIKRYHQICMCHYIRIRLLRSAQRNKYAYNNTTMKNIITKVNNKT